MGSTCSETNFKKTFLIEDRVVSRGFFKTSCGKLSRHKRKASGRDMLPGSIFQVDFCETRQRARSLHESPAYKNVAVISRKILPSSDWCFSLLYDRVDSVRFSQGGATTNYRKSDGIRYHDRCHREQHRGNSDNREARSKVLHEARLKTGHRYAGPAADFSSDFRSRPVRVRHYNRVFNRLCSIHVVAWSKDRS